MLSGPEAKIQAQIVKTLEAEGCLVLLLSCANRRGFPDLSVMKNGRIVFIEVKTPTGKVSAHQWQMTEELFDFGHTTYIASDATICEQVVRDLAWKNPLS